MSKHTKRPGEHQIAREWMWQPTHMVYIMGFEWFEPSPYTEIAFTGAVFSPLVGHSGLI